MALTALVLTSCCQCFSLFFSLSPFLWKPPKITTYLDQIFGSRNFSVHTPNITIWQTFIKGHDHLCDYILSSFEKRESERKNVQLCKQQVDSSKPHRVFYLCGQEPDWTIALFPRRPQSETSTLVRHENMESAGTTLRAAYLCLRLHIAIGFMFHLYFPSMITPEQKKSVECGVFCCRNT